MNSATEAPRADRSSKVTSGVWKRFAQIIIVFIIQAAILLGVSSQLGWIWAWVFLGISTLSVFINGIIMARKSLEMIAERGDAKLTKTWDKVVAGVYGLSLFLAVPFVAGLDIRLSWTGQLNTGWHIGGAIVLASALAFASWAMIENAFFSTAVRIQTDRGHTVCRTGPYRLIRHPGYAGFILQSLATPILLGSMWALLPGVVAALALVARTSFEDRTLKAELPGYSEYTQEVRYRLLAGIW
jgi:protein-S-isoprenylcysteine O-methyltransferase Ste14